MSTSLIELIKNYYEKRELKWPSFNDAMKFVVTEIGEVYEVDLARVGGFVRNNPQDKPIFSKELLAEELGDAIFMLMVAGIVEGVNPLTALLSKMDRKLKKISGESKITIISEEEAKEIIEDRVVFTGGGGLVLSDSTAKWWLEALGEKEKDGN